MREGKGGRGAFEVVVRGLPPGSFQAFQEPSAGSCRETLPLFHSLIVHHDAGLFGYEPARARGLRSAFLASGQFGVMALDVGGRRIGVALSDTTRVLASPLTTPA